AGAPANCSNTIAVGATDSSDTKPSWSNYGTNVDIYAPGVNVISTVNRDVDGGYRGTPPSPDYDSFSGTSMATPHVSGVAALVWSSSYGSSASSVISRILNNYDTISVSPGGSV